MIQKLWLFLGFPSAVSPLWNPFRRKNLIRRQSMKTNAGSFIFIGGILSAIFSPAVSHAGTFQHPLLVNISGPFPSDCAATQFVLHRADKPFPPVRRSVYPLSDDELSDPLAEASDSQPDDDGRADSNKLTRLTNVMRDESPGCGLSKLPAEWQLLQPDTKRTNSFIHSKAKPPPYENNHKQ